MTGEEIGMAKKLTTERELLQWQGNPIHGKRQNMDERAEKLHKVQASSTRKCGKLGRNPKTR